MKIKNTRELVLRAQGHARFDHIIQGTYGESNCNGNVEFEGCAIGCLSTPHRKSELRSFIRRLGDFDPYDGEYVLSETDKNQLPRLRKEFGICSALARCAEAIFEGLEHHGDAINFIPAFAKSLPEGVNITPRMVRAAWSSATNGRGTCEATYYQWIHNDYSVDLNGGHYDAPTPEQVRERFLVWLESLA